MSYKIEFRAWVMLLLPWPLRRPFLTAWLYILLHPARQLNDQLDGLATATRVAARRNGQVMLLREALNDQFDPVQRRLSLFHVGPGQFQVRHPASLSITGANLDRLIAFVNKYRQMGTSFTVVII